MEVEGNDSKTFRLRDALLHVSSDLEMFRCSYLNSVPVWHPSKSRLSQTTAHLSKTKAMTPIESVSLNF